MSNEQALALIMQVASLAPVNKQTHMDVEKAVKQILEALREQEKKNG